MDKEKEELSKEHLLEFAMHQINVQLDIFKDTYINEENVKSYTERIHYLKFLKDRITIVLEELEDYVIENESPFK
ncbi:hypothetical protein BRE01_67340 [Brevibacillus reuszeri]|uniref:Uncharacterized protein n=1 Tax=Brevibacillus reuszeri TaxID=54915 RepID=A0A0K9YN91_9BACL|nr:hypothetical protein [Brevibacillus reuszeri]KNB70184.1 hypothetical protein ADS79_14535 [Brevibacillus reuszeri]GED73032.1 hypothetical protein BRE01_67340 [Brevibacillus reuszeri]